MALHLYPIYDYKSQGVPVMMMICSALKLDSNTLRAERENDWLSQVSLTKQITHLLQEGITASFTYSQGSHSF